MLAAQPLALLCYQSDPALYPRPMFAPRELFLGPDVKAPVADGAFSARPAPIGDYDLAQEIGDLAPDLVLVKPDATGRNVPRNLGAVPGVKVLVLGDTHHLDHPIRWLLGYAASEPFDLILGNHARQHLHFFAHGLPTIPIYWPPLLSVNVFPPPEDRALRYPLVFVGAKSPWHPYRTLILERLEAAGLPLQIGGAPQPDAARVLARSRIALNVSLNGDLNHRVGEILSAGSLLLTDRLAPEAGLARLFADGQQAVYFDGPEDAIEKARHYLDHPDQADAIRAAGQKTFHEQHAPARKMRQLHDLALNGTVDPLWSMDGEPRHRHGAPESHEDLLVRIAVYEAAQELHRRRPRPFLRLGPGTDPAFASDAADLPRLLIERACADEADYRQTERYLGLTRTQERVDLVPLPSLQTPPPADSLLVLRASDLAGFPPSALSPNLFLPDLYFVRGKGPAHARLDQLGFRQTDHGFWQAGPGHD